MKFRTKKSNQVSVAIQHHTPKAGMGACLLTPLPAQVGCTGAHRPRLPSAVVYEEAKCCWLLQQVFGFSHSLNYLPIEDPQQTHERIRPLNSEESSAKNA